MLSSLIEKKQMHVLQKLFQKHVKEYLLTVNADLRQIASHAFSGEAKFFRPLIVLSVAQRRKAANLPLDAALAIECFHTACCIADDLPCMDDSKMRRKREALHVAYGDSKAILASMGLISEGYAAIFRETTADNERKLLAIKETVQRGGFSGVIKGQYLDLFSHFSTKEEIEEMIHLKTIVAFELSFILGWIFSGGDLQMLEKVGKLGYHIGFALQIADDLLDENEDAQRGVQCNIVGFLGRKAAIELLKKEIQSYEKGLLEVNLEGGEMEFFSRAVLEHSKL